MKQLGHQGDTQWYELDSIPSNAKKVDKQFIAASERSGSFHALFGNYDMYEVDGGFVIEAHEECILNHSLQKELDGINMDIAKQLPKKDHRHSIIKKGTIAFVGIQNRFDPMENIKRKVID